MREGWENRQFLANKSPYLRNRARLKIGPYALSIGTKIIDLG